MFDPQPDASGASNTCVCEPTAEQRGASFLLIQHHSSASKDCVPSAAFVLFPALERSPRHTTQGNCSQTHLAAARWLGWQCQSSTFVMLHITVCASSDLKSASESTWKPMVGAKPAGMPYSVRWHLKHQVRPLLQHTLHKTK